MLRKYEVSLSYKNHSERYHNKIDLVYDKVISILTLPDINIERQDRYNAGIFYHTTCCPTLPALSSVILLLSTANTAATKLRNPAFLFPQCDKHPAPPHLLSMDSRYGYCGVIASLGLTFPWVSAVWSLSLLRPRDHPLVSPSLFLSFSVSSNQ